jgi:hypothetical protein
MVTMRDTSRRALALCLLIPLGGATAPAQPPPTTPPTAAMMAPTILAVGPQAGFGDVLVLGTGARLEIAPTTPPQVPVLDGQQVPASALAGPWPPGPHGLALQSVPPAGGAPVVQPPMRFVYDPLPPAVQWEVGDITLLDLHGLDQDVERQKPPRHTVPEPDRHVRMLWSPDGRRWLPLLPKHAEADAHGALADWLTAADRPQVFLWALKGKSFGDGAPVTPKKMQIVRVWATDDLSAVRDLRLRVLPAAGGNYRLEMVATDLVGNATTVSWPLLRH